MVLGEYTTLGSNVRVADGAEVRRSVVADNGYLGAGARVAGRRDRPLLRPAAGRPLRARARCSARAAWSGAHAEVRAGVKVYPFKTVETGAVVNSSIVWESQGLPDALRPRRGAGHRQRRHQPRAGGAALDGLGLDPRTRAPPITVSRDTSRAARVLKRAVMVGCNAAGVNVEDLEVATVPVTRHHVRTTGQPGRGDRPAGAGRPRSRWCSGSSTREGLDLDETGQRKIERLYHREEFRRVLAGEIGDIDFPARAVEQYTADLMGVGRPVRARDGGLKLVLDLSYGSASFVMPNLLSKLDADVLVVNPYAHTPGMMSVDRDANAARVADLVRASGAQLGAVVDADGEHLAIVDDEGTVLSDDQALLVLLAPGGRDPARTPGWPCRWRSAARPRRSAAEAGVADHLTKLSSAHLMEVAVARRRHLRRQPVRRVPLAGLPPRLRRRGHRWSSWWRCCWPTGQPLSKLVHALPAGPHRPRDGGDPVGAEGHWSCGRLVEQLDGRDLVLVDGVKVPEDGRLGPRPARPRGPGDPRLGRGAERGPGPGPGPAVRGAARQLLR